MAEQNNIFVVDASFVLAYLLPDEQTAEKTQALFEDYAENLVSFISPVLLPFEVLNGIHMAQKRKRLSKVQANHLIQDFLAYAIVLEEVDFSQTASLAQQYDLSMYDASYVCLANTKKLPLLTFDKRLEQCTHATPL